MAGRTGEIKPDAMTAHEALLRKLESGEALVGVIGLGYVGLPLALTIAESAFPVLGFDVDAKKIDRLVAGESYLEHIAAERIRDSLERQRLQATSAFDRLSEPDVLLICVPTPLDAERQPDLSYLDATAEQIQRRLRPGQLVVLESTTYPGTTEDYLQPLLEASGLTCGRDFFLAYSPEREDPGNPDFATGSIPKVIGGVDATASRLADALYKRVIDETVVVSSARVAEAAKLTENVYRAVNIALVNELKLIYTQMGIDIWEVLDAAETKPFGFKRFDPGPGWGGHCIPIDPFYLAWKARQHGADAEFIELAGRINTEMPRRVVAALEEALTEREKSLTGSRILILGLAYKRDVDDPRESPAFAIIDELLGRGANVGYHDPHIPRAPSMRSWPELPAMESEPLDREHLESVDAVIIVTDHSGVDYDLVLEHAPLIVDTRGTIKGVRRHLIRA